MAGKVKNLTREEQILKYVEKSSRGIEMAPWHSPIAPKKSGFNIRCLDIFDTKTLKQRCASDENILHLCENIEDVDFVCSALDIAEHISGTGEIGNFDYIISSHNFEHLPDPIRFLRACGEVLAPNGYLSMAIPDKRRTFDYIRTLSRTSDLIKFYFEGRTQPTPYDIFDYHSKYLRDIPILFSTEVTGASWTYALEDAFEKLKDSVDKECGYEDAHVTVFTAKSFEAIILELIRLDLIPFQLVEITEAPGVEFYVHLKNVGYGHPSRSMITDQHLLDAYLAVQNDDISASSKYTNFNRIKSAWKKMKRIF